MELVLRRPRPADRESGERLEAIDDLVVVAVQPLLAVQPSVRLRIASKMRRRGHRLAAGRLGQAILAVLELERLAAAFTTHEQPGPMVIEPDDADTVRRQRVLSLARSDRFGDAWIESTSTGVASGDAAASSGRRVVRGLLRDHGWRRLRRQGRFRRLRSCRLSRRFGRRLARSGRSLRHGRHGVAPLCVAGRERRNRSRSIEAAFVKARRDGPLHREPRGGRRRTTPPAPGVPATVRRSPPRRRPPRSNAPEPNDRQVKVRQE